MFVATRMRPICMIRCGGASLTKRFRMGIGVRGRMMIYTVSTVHAKRKNIPETRFERSSKNARAQLMHHHGIHEDPSGSPVFSDPNDGAMEEPRFHDDEG
eukprot:75801_1